MSTHRILVVEDEPDIAAVLTMLLRSSGHVVHAVADVASAREALAGPLPDLVLLDVLLPDGDGLDLCREIKAAHPTLPVMVITAEARAGEKAVGAGADLVVVKPFDPDDLERQVAMLARAPVPSAV